MVRVALITSVLGMLSASACARVDQRGQVGDTCLGGAACAGGLECFRGVCLEAEAVIDGGRTEDDVGATRDTGDTSGDDASLLRDAQLDTLRADTGPLDAALSPPPPPAPPDSTGPVLPPPPEGVYEVEPGFYDAVLDWERHRLFLSQGSAGVIEVLDLSSGAHGFVVTGHHADRMHFDPYRDEILVALAEGYHFRGDPPGFLGIVNPATLTLRPPIALPHDPWDVTSDGWGLAYVTIGTEYGPLQVVNLDTGVVTAAGEGVDERRSLEIHPNRRTAYGAGRNNSWDHVERFDLGPGGTYRYRSDVVELGRCDAVRVDPTGRMLYANCGDTYFISESWITDLERIGSRGTPWTDLAFTPTGREALLLHGGAALDVYDVASWTLARTIPLPEPPVRVFVGETYAVIIGVSAGGAPAGVVHVLAWTRLR